MFFSSQEKITGTYTVSNPGEINVSSFVVSLYLVDSSRTIIKTLQSQTIDSLSANASRKISFEIDPGELSAGSYSLLTKVDSEEQIQEYYENNNTRSTGITIKPCLPDFTVSALTLNRKESYGKIRIDSHETISGSFTVSNSGYKNASQVNVILKLVSADGRVVKELVNQNISSLAIDEKSTIDFFINAGDCPQGEYSLQVSVDSGNRVEEINDDNNAQILSDIVIEDARPELEVTSLKITDSSGGSAIVKNSNALLSFKIKNNAINGSSSPTEALLKINGKTVCSIPVSAVGNQSEIYVQTKLDGALLPAGQCQIELEIDPDRKNRDLNEANNKASTTVTVTDEKKNKADLTVSALKITYPADLSISSQKADDLFTIDFSICNTGTADAGKTVAKIQLDSGIFAFVDIKPLAVGTSENYQIQFTRSDFNAVVKSKTNDTYANCAVTVDALNSVDETSESNNCSTVTFATAQAYTSKIEHDKTGYRLDLRGLDGYFSAAMREVSIIQSLSKIEYELRTYSSGTYSSTAYVVLNEQLNGGVIADSELLAKASSLYTYSVYCGNMKVGTFDQVRSYNYQGKSLGRNGMTYEYLPIDLSNVAPGEYQFYVVAQPKAGTEITTALYVVAEVNYMLYYEKRQGSYPLNYRSTIKVSGNGTLSPTEKKPSLSFSCSNVQVGWNQENYKSGRISFELKNTSNFVFFANSLIDVYEVSSGQKIGSLTMPYLASGETAELSLDFDSTWFSSGRNEIELRYAPETYLGNSDWSSAVERIAFTVPEAPDLEFSEFSLSSNTCTPYDDLVVSVCVKNSGAVGSAATQVSLYDGNLKIGTLAINALDAGKSSSRLQYLIKAGTLEENKIHQITAKIDESENILEKNEDNNVQSSILVVTKRPQAVSDYNGSSGGSGAPEPTTISSYYVTGDFAGIGQDYLGKEGDSDSILHIYQTGAEWGSTAVEKGWTFYDSVDFNGDGKADLLRSNADNKLVVGEVSNGNGTFTPQVLNALGDGWQILGTGDFNGNGVGDVLVANPTAASETVGLLGYWEGGTTWNLINGYSAEWEMVSTDDFNGDGKTDMLWKNSFIGEGGKTYNAYCTWIVDNANDWRMVSVANPEDWNFLCTGDFDGDNTADIAMINGEGVVGIWGVNDGYLSSWSILSAVDTNTWNLAGVGDFNGDGTDDIAWCNADTNLAGYWQINDKQLTTWQTIGTLA